MVTNSNHRIKKYKAKIDSSLIGKRYEATKDLATRKQTKVFQSQYWIEKVVKVIVTGVPSIFIHQYMNFANEIYFNKLESEREIIYCRWLRRGLNEELLTNISKVLNYRFPPSYGMIEWINTNDETQWDFSGPEWAAQKFTIGDNGKDRDNTLDKLRLKFFRTENPGLITISIKGEDLTGPDLSVATYDGNSLTTNHNGEWIDVPMPPITLQKSTNYSIVVRAIDGDFVNYINWRANMVLPNPGGGLWVSMNSGVNWTSIYFRNGMFEVWSKGCPFM